MRLLLLLLLFGFISLSERAEAELVFEVWTPRNALNLEVLEGSGTGFWINQEGYALTAAHVVHRQRIQGMPVIARRESTVLDKSSLSLQEVQELVNNGELIALSIVDCDDMVDLCLLRSSSFSVSEELPAIGTPLAPPKDIVTKGLFYSNNQKQFPSDYSLSVATQSDGVIRLSNVLPRGFSGAPAIENDRIIGIAQRRDDINGNGIVLEISKAANLLSRNNIDLVGDAFSTIAARLSALESQVGDLIRTVARQNEAISRLQAELWFDTRVEYKRDENDRPRRDLIVRHDKRFSGQFRPKRVSITIVPIIASVNESDPKAKYLPIPVEYSRTFDGEDIARTLVVSDFVDSVSDQLAAWRLKKIEDEDVSEDHAPSFADVTSFRVEIRVWFDEMKDLPKKYVHEIHRLPI